MNAVFYDVVGQVRLALGVGEEIPGGSSTRLWNIVFALKNYGTLPAQNVGLAFDFFTDNTSRAKKTRIGFSRDFSI